MSERDPIGAARSGEDLVLDHVAASRAGLDALVAHRGLIVRWAGALHATLTMGGRLLVAGNGGSAALGEHLTAELVGRYRDERRPFSAVALTADTATLTALANDYGYEECFARQITAHARPADIVLLLTTSGRSPNLLRAAEAAHDAGARSWALTGPAPSPLAAVADEVLPVDAPSGAAVQEAQQVAVHALCALFDRCVAQARERVGVR
jgi:D-sedoheptulose 7-phosphate isomerase